ncbi:MAG: hypothetical protein P8Y97_15860 [Candidatus Lokiarchaeota archaeon]
MPVGYCPKCAKEVYMKREEINICLCIILAIFTAGFGLLIYMVIYLDKKEDRCIHCNSLCLPISPSNAQQVPRQVVYHSQSKNYSNSSQISGISKNDQNNDCSEIRYCHSCGNLLHDPDNARYCSFCGAELD